VVAFARRALTVVRAGCSVAAVRSATGLTVAAPWAGCSSALASGCWPLAAGIWFNWQLGVEDKRSLLAYDH